MQNIPLNAAPLSHPLPHPHRGRGWEWDGGRKRENLIIL